MEGMDKQIRMTPTMRWYGPNDGVTLTNIRQAGAKGIVTALHQIPVGEVWNVEDIKERQEIIKEAGLEWMVVESLPVHEAIKQRRGDFIKYIENYKESLKNLSECGLEVVTYNFMPVLDWVRTDVLYNNPDGSKTLFFNKLAFVYFDLEILKRPGAENDYNEALKNKARSYGSGLSLSERDLLRRTVMLGLPGSDDHFTESQLLQLLEEYKHITDELLRKHLLLFLEEVAPVAQELGMELAIHPDDPPYPLLGLPRVVSNYKDLSSIFSGVPLAANGLCYCTGSLGAGPKNDLLKIARDFGDRIHFLHLRNVRKEPNGNFMEAEHLDGDNPMEAIVLELLQRMKHKQKSLPMRPDHGFLHDFESGIKAYPGYSLMGRMKGLAEIRGMEQGLLYHRNMK